MLIKFTMTNPATLRVIPVLQTQLTDPLIDWPVNWHTYRPDTLTDTWSVWSLTVAQDNTATQNQQMWFKTSLEKPVAAPKNVHRSVDVRQCALAVNMEYICWCIYTCLTNTGPSTGGKGGKVFVGLMIVWGAHHRFVIIIIIIVIIYFAHKIQINFQTWQYMSMTDKAIKLLQLPWKQNINQEKCNAVRAVQTDEWNGIRK